MTSDSFSRLAQLRAETRDAHARIETVPALSRLLSPALTRAEYATILQYMHAYLVHMEPAIAAALEAFPTAVALLDGSRPRALAEDLAWLAVPPITPPRLPTPDCAEAAFGALYVIEGSGLGGRVIARHLADHLAIGPGAGGNFYGGLTADAARERWRRLSTVLESDITAAPAPHAPKGEAVMRAAMVEGARAVFHGLEHWLRRITVAPNTTQQLGSQEVAGAVAP